MSDNFTRRTLIEALVEALGLDDTDIRITSANDDGDVTIKFTGLPLDDAVEEDAEDDEDDSEDDEDSDDAVEEDANDTSDIESPE